MKTLPKKEIKQIWKCHNEVSYLKKLPVICREKPEEQDKIYHRDVVSGKIKTMVCVASRD